MKKLAGHLNIIAVREKTPVPLYGGLYGVSDETRTRDSQDHNLVLYQLNYAHHMVYLKGFEPLTFWSVARHSIQLS